MSITLQTPTRGQVVLLKRDIKVLVEQRDYFDIVTKPWSPRYEHCGICVQDNVMIAAQGKGGVGYQGSNGVLCVGVDVPWAVPFEQVEAWMRSQFGRPYDFPAYALIMLPWFFKKNLVPNGSYICSAFVATALQKFAPSVGITAYRTTVPDEVARVLKC